MKIPPIVEYELRHALVKHPHRWRGNWHAMCVLGEEVLEVAWALVRGDKDNLRQEVAQVCAVCLRWLRMMGER